MAPFNSVTRLSFYNQENFGSVNFNHDITEFIVITAVIALSPQALFAIIALGSTSALTKMPLGFASIGFFINKLAYKLTLEKNFP